MLRYFRKLRLRLSYGDTWTSHPGHPHLVARTYTSYHAYLQHQRGKLRYLDLSTYDVRYRQALRDRLAQLDMSWHGRNVLCVAARIGTEVKAFQDLGCFAVGIDINPGQKNRYVLYGDFHNLQFPSQSADIVFTNSLDHAFDVHTLMAEMHRVLKPRGILILEVSKGSVEGRPPSSYESFWWNTIDDVVSLFEHARFRVLRRIPFAYPSSGEQLCFEREAETGTDRDHPSPAQMRHERTQVAASDLLSDSSRRE